MYNDATLYPMLAVGAFNAMFWVGFVLGVSAGLGCLPLLLCGLGSGYLGTCLVAGLESRASGNRRRYAAAPARAGKSGTPARLPVLVTRPG